MSDNRNDPTAPVRVVVFTSGPELRPAILRFVQLLEDHPDIEVLRVYCQTRGSGFRFIVRDLWRRRKILAVPLLVSRAMGRLYASIFRRRETLGLRRTTVGLADRLRYVSNIHAADVLEDVSACTPDVGLIYGSPILKPELFDLPIYGTLGIHHGKMPEYRGKKTTFWALYNNEPTAGVTIQKVNAGLDTGQIIRQGEVTATGRSLGAVWSDLEELGYDLYVEAVLEMRSGPATASATPGTRGPLYRDPKLTDLVRFMWRRYLRGKSRFTETDSGQNASRTVAT